MRKTFASRSRRATCSWAPTSTAAFPIVSDVRRLSSFDGPGAAPELLELVEFPLALGEDVQDDVAVVDQHPARVVVALRANPLDARILHLLDDAVRQRPDMDV